MPEHIELQLPYYRASHWEKPANHTIITLQVPWINPARAAFYHAFLHELHTNGYGAFTSEDIFPHQDENRIKRADWIMDNRTVITLAAGYADGGNVTRGGSTDEREAQLAYANQKAINDLEAYLQLPREIALTKTRTRYPDPYEDTIITISEAEHWLRHYITNIEFTDDAEIRHEHYERRRQQQNLAQE